jgi:hypothetical protein
MSVNRQRCEPVCLCCESRRPQKFSLFCEECFSTNPDGCRRVMGMAAYNAVYPKPKAVKVNG